MFVAVLAVLLFTGGLFFFLWKTVIHPLLNESNSVEVPVLEGQMIDDVITTKNIPDNFEIVVSSESVYLQKPPVQLLTSALHHTARLIKVRL